MAGVLVDSSVLLDVFTEDVGWSDWSSAALTAAADASRLIINPVVFAEVSIRFSRIEELDERLPRDMFHREPIPFEAAFLAGKAFVRYRRRGGQHSAPLPDFFIGAHAAAAGHRLLTRDPKRIRTHFPTVELIAP
jgi:predicted nucleic acid-binding protein